MKHKIIAMVGLIFFCSVALFVVDWARAEGPSFDCAKASTKIEKMICADEELSELDFRLGRDYAKALRGTNNPSALKQQQIDWLKTRNSCREKTCLVASYKSRLTLLKTEMGSGFGFQSATGTSPIQTLPYSFKLARDTGWTVCHDLIKNYNKLQPPKESFACEIRFDPGMSQFSWPQWEVLKTEEYLDVIYSIESHVFSSEKLPSFEVWRKQYLADMSTGFSWRQAYGGQRVRAGFHPRLRQARVRFESEGRLETVLGYTREYLAVERCRDVLTNCPLPIEESSETYLQMRKCTEKLYEKWGGVQMDRPGEYIVLYEPEARNVRFIRSGDRGASMSSHLAGHLFLHSNRAFLALVTVSGITVSRIERLEFENPAIKSFERGRQICNIHH